MRSPWSWFAWALILPLAALLTPRAYAAAGAPGALVFWSLAILLGGAVELVVLRRSARLGGHSTLARWALRGQGNLSLVGMVLTLAIVIQAPQLAGLLPGLWLLLLGHSFYGLGGIAFPPLKISGVIYQAGGIVALWPGVGALGVFAVTALVANAWMGLSLWRRSSD